jgi:thiol:disulfide interchange protein DsbD
LKFLRKSRNRNVPIKLGCKVLLFAAACLALGPAPSKTSAKVVPAPHTKVELVSDVSQVGPNAPFWVGIRFVIEEGWHIYWQNPGDSGSAPEFEWTLPQGFEQEPIRWPLPERIPVSHLMNYGYRDQVILPARVLPRGLDPGTSQVSIEVDAAWLVCREECIPAEAVLSLEIPVGAEARPSEWAGAIRDELRQVPRPSDMWDTRVVSHADAYEIRLTPRTGSVEGITRVDFFPADPLTIHNAYPQRLKHSEGTLSLFVKKDPKQQTGPDRLRGELGLFSEDASSESRGALRLDAPVESGFPLWRAVLLALAGGFLLNLMPCVFPVISIKILSFVEHAHREGATPVVHGLMYGFGILLSFWVLSGLLFALRAAGMHLGWGFQLQSPVFLSFMAVLFFLIGLNLLGAFEFGLLFTRLGGIGMNRTGYGGSFLSGILATLIATPCTAPFMGSALGFAMAQPVSVGLAVFTALGVGMALPYVILSSQPGLVKRLPRPGAWMETLKQFLAFPMFATLIWILWVLGNQVGPDGVIRCLAGLFLLSLGIWIFGRAPTVPGKRFRGAWIRAGAAAVILAGLLGAMTQHPGGVSRMPAQENKGAHALWEPFSEARIQELRRAGRPLFVNFTAAWCITCQVNKRLVLDRPEVLAAFERYNIELMKADWTNRDDDISRALARYGRRGVPVYVLYGSGNGSEPVLLPEILTVDLVLDALERHAGPRDLSM